MIDLASIKDAAERVHAATCENFGNTFVVKADLDAVLAFVRAASEVEDAPSEAFESAPLRAATPEPLPFGAYRIDTVADMLAVPAELRAKMLRDLETALSLHEFVQGSSEPLPIRSIVWRDDGDGSAILTDRDGRPMLELEVETADKESQHG